MEGQADKLKSLPSFVLKVAALSHEEIFASEEEKENIFKFLAHNDDAQLGIYTVQIIYGKFLPKDAQFENGADEIVQQSLPFLHKHILDTLEILSGMSTDRDEYIKCLFTGVEAFSELLNYFSIVEQHNGIHITKAESVPNTLISIFKSLLWFLQEKCGGGEREFEDLQKEVITLSPKMFMTLKSISWTDNEDTLNVLATACEGVGDIAQCLCKLGALKELIEAWKLFTFLISIEPQRLATKLCLTSSLGYLASEILDDLCLLSIALIENAEDEKLYLRTIQKNAFYLKIIIHACELYKGFLRSCHFTLLRVILSVYKFRYSSDSLIHKYEKEFLEHVDQQLIIGTEKLISLLIGDNYFAEEVMTYVSDSVPNDGSAIDILLLLISVLKLLIALKAEDTNPWEPLQLLENVCHLIPYSHVELCYPLKLPGIMHGGHSQEFVSLYAYCLMNFCSFVSVLDELQYESFEKILMECVLNPNIWKVLFASDVFCFIARYGTISLCDSYCILLIDILKDTSLDNAVRIVCQMLLSRLLGFLNSSGQKRFFDQLMDDYLSTRNILVWEVLDGMSVKIETEGETRSDVLISKLRKERLDMKLTSGSTEDIKDLMNILETLSCYSANEAVETDEIKDQLKSGISIDVMKLFRRIPVDYINDAVVSRLFCLTLRIVSYMIPHLSEEHISLVLSGCSEAIKKRCYGAAITSCDLLSKLGCVLFSDRRTLSKLEEIILTLLSFPSDFVLMSALTALISFAKNTTHEDVFSNCINLCGPERAELVTRYLQMIPREIPEGDQVLPQYLKGQQQTLLAISIGSEATPRKDERRLGSSTISDEGWLESDNRKDEDELESISKRRRREDEETETGERVGGRGSVASNFEVLLESLMEVKKAIGDKKSLFTDRQRQKITRLLSEINNMWNAI